MKTIDKTWCDAAQAVARKAGAVLKAGMDQNKQINFQDSRDVKLQSDLDSEKLIRQKLKATGLSVIGEEEGGDTNLINGEDFYWVVDPLDGTYNYLREQPLVCVSVGLMRGQEFVYGVIYDFMRDEMLCGGKDLGLTLNGELIEPKWILDQDQACIATGFPAGSRYTSETLLEFMEKIRQFKKIRMLGTAAIAIAYVAQGRVDAYYEESTRLWDFAAGAALVEAAGGTVQAKLISDVDELKYNVWAVANKDWIS